MISNLLVMWSALSFAQQSAPKTALQLEEPKSQSGVSIDLFHKSSYDFRTKKIDVLASSFGAEWDFTGRGFDRFLEAPDADVFGLKIRLWGVPFLLNDSVRGDLDDSIVSAVDQQLANNPQYQALPPGTQAVFRQQAIDSIQAEQHGRLHQVQLETTIQQVAFTYGHSFGDGSILFLDVGKMPVHAGPTTGYHGLSETEFLGASNNPIQRSLNAMSTGALHARWGFYGVQPAAKQDREQSFSQKFVSALAGIPASIGADLYIFTERSPFITGRNYLETIAQLPDNEYEDHKDWYELDSGVLRVSSDTDFLSLYLSGGLYHGEGAYGLGGAINLERDDDLHRTWSFSFDTNYGERERGMNFGFTTQVTRHFLGEKARVWGAFDSGNNNYTPLVDREQDFSQVRLGAGYTCPLGLGLRHDLSVGAAGELICGDTWSGSGEKLEGTLTFWMGAKF